MAREQRRRTPGLQYKGQYARESEDSHRLGKPARPIRPRQDLDLKRISALTFALVLVLGTSAQPQPTITPEEEEQLQQDVWMASGGPWHYATIHCVETTVKWVGYRLYDYKTHEPSRDSGSAVTFSTRLGLEGSQGPNAPSVRAGVTKYGTDPIIAAERAGDKVQVCLLSIPEPSRWCNPDRDSRGRKYRVYDYRQKAAYVGENGEHYCGGA